MLHYFHTLVKRSTPMQLKKTAERGMEYLFPCNVPCNDGNVSVLGPVNRAGILLSEKQNSPMMRHCEKSK